MILSTGMATIAELDEAVHTARSAGCSDITLLKCTSSYPASPEFSNVLTIPHMRQLFNCKVGLSDHTLGIGVAVASVALGAEVIEKHFTLSREEGGVDAAFSLEPDELKALVVESERAYQSLGEVFYGRTEKEKASLQFRRSLYIVKDIEEGERFTPDNLKAIRPGLGLPPKYMDVFLGKVAKRRIARGTPLSWDLL